MTFFCTFLCCHLSPKILPNLSIRAVRRKIENNAYAKFCWASIMGDVQVANFTFYGGRKEAKTKSSLFLNLSAVPKKSTPATNFEKNAS